MTATASEDYENIPRRSLLLKVLDMVTKGLLPEIATRLMGLADLVCRTGKRIYRIGRMILCRIHAFVAERPYLAIGIAVGLFITLVISNVPVLGTFLAPIAALLTIPLCVATGHRVDARTRGESMEQRPLIEDAISALGEFTKELVALCREATSIWVEDPA